MQSHTEVAVVVAVHSSAAATLPHAEPEQDGS